MKRIISLFLAIACLATLVSNSAFAKGYGKNTFDIEEVNDKTISTFNEAGKSSNVSAKVVEKDGIYSLYINGEYTGAYLMYNHFNNTTGKAEDEGSINHILFLVSVFDEDDLDTSISILKLFASAIMCGVDDSLDMDSAYNISEPYIEKALSNVDTYKFTYNDFRYAAVVTVDAGFALLGFQVGTSDLTNM